MFADNRINHLQEPKRLCLAWNVPGMMRCVVGELVLEEDANVTLRYFPDSSDFKTAKEKGMDLLPAFPEPSLEYSSGVMEFFMSRITSRKRTDFDLYLKSLGIDPAQQEQISDFALLGYGEGRLPSDGFHVVNDYAETSPPVEFLTEAAGLSYGAYVDRIDEVTLNQTVRFDPEPDNAHDPNAVAIKLNDLKLGYINRIQAPAVGRWIEQGFNVQGTIFRKNGLSSAPRVFVFMEVSGA